MTAARLTTLTTPKKLTLEDGLAAVEAGAAFIDLRDAGDYLDAHIRGSLALGFEFGPGMASRARDCLPLDLPLVLLEDPGSDVAHAAAALRGKGFAVVGAIGDGLGAWGRRFGHPASTERVTRVPDGATALDVLDPGANTPEDARRIPLEVLWPRTKELRGEPIVVVAGFGIRAALAVGILEHAGARDVSVLDTRR